MASRRQTQVAEAIAHAAADFYAKEWGGRALLTVTRADISPDLRNASVYISVLPHGAEAEALHFAKRMRSDLRDYLKGKSVLKVLPTIDVVLDEGEKNRQRIDDLTRN